LKNLYHATKTENSSKNKNENKKFPNKEENNN